MGIRNKNGQPVLTFNCVQCNAKNKTDFRTYPICKKCNTVNKRLAKRNENGHFQENIVEKKKKRGPKPFAYEKYKDLCDRIAEYKNVDGLSDNKISKIFNSEGIKNASGLDWTANSIQWLYTLHLKNKKD